jgi:hypothetical protein
MWQAMDRIKSGSGRYSIMNIVVLTVTTVVVIVIIVIATVVVVPDGVLAKVRN